MTGKELATALTAYSRFSHALHLASDPPAILEAVTRLLRDMRDKISDPPSLARELDAFCEFLKASGIRDLPASEFATKAGLVGPRPAKTGRAGTRRSPLDPATPAVDADYAKKLLEMTGQEAVERVKNDRLKQAQIRSLRDWWPGFDPRGRSTADLLRDLQYYVDRTKGDQIILNFAHRSDDGPSRTGPDTTGRM